MRQPLALTLPMILALAGQAATVGQTDRFLPLVLDGGGWTTQITVTNLSGKPAQVVAGFLTAAGYAEPWRVSLQASSGKTSGGTAEISLAPGATAVIDTSGTTAVLTRGFVEMIEVNGQPIGGFAILTQRIGETIVQSIRIPLSPGHERRSTMLLDLRNPLQKAQLVWVSLTSSVALDVTFRDITGEIVLKDQVNLDGRAQLSMDVAEQWQALKGFHGTLEWTVTFPFADRYEQRTLAALLVLAAEGQPWAVLSGMTLPADQAAVEPY